MNSNTRDKEYRERVRLLLAQGLGTRQIAKDTCRRHCYVGRIKEEIQKEEARKAAEVVGEVA